MIDDKAEQLMKQDYFVFVMHRQENFMNSDFVKDVVNRIVKIAETRSV